MKKPSLSGARLAEKETRQSLKKGGDRRRSFQPRILKIRSLRRRRGRAWQLPSSRDEAFFFETVTLSLWQGEEEGVLGEGHARRLEGFLLCSDSCCVRMILKIASLQWGRKMLYVNFSNDLRIADLPGLPDVSPGIYTLVPG